MSHDTVPSFRLPQWPRVSMIARARRGETPARIHRVRPPTGFARREAPTAPSAPPPPKLRNRPRRRAPATPPALPSSTRGLDFSEWVARALAGGDPAGALKRLEAHRDDPKLRRDAAQHLRTLVARDAVDARSLLFAVAAAAHLRLAEARAPLIELCRRADERMARSPCTPRVEEHLALVALGALDHGAPFDAAAAYAEHKEMVDRVTHPRAPLSLLCSFSEMYRDLLGEYVPRVELELEPSVTVPQTMMHRLQRPKPLNVSAIGAVVGAVLSAILLPAYGGGLGVVALMLVMAGMGLLSDQRNGWLAGVGGLGLSTLYLVLAGLFTPAGPVLLVGAGVGGALGASLHPTLRKRYAPPRLAWR